MLSFWPFHLTNRSLAALEQQIQEEKQTIQNVLEELSAVEIKAAGRLRGGGKGEP
jgi:hypothetical protein